MPQSREEVILSGWGSRRLYPQCALHVGRNTVAARSCCDWVGLAAMHVVVCKRQSITMFPCFRYCAEVVHLPTHKHSSGGRVLNSLHAMHGQHLRVHVLGGDGAY